MNQLMAKKIEMTQMYDESGKQLPVTILEIVPAVVTRIKTAEKDGYAGVQVGFGSVKDKNVTKPVAGQVKSLTDKPRKFVEERLEDTDGLSVGQTISLAEVLAVGDMLSASGMSKGKGFQGGVKRWGFAGGPKTHGQSDRHRAPGSIGSGTSPGKVWKGLRMAGHMGHRQTTTRGLRILNIDGNRVWIKGAVPGAKQSWVLLKKQGATS